MTVRLLLPRVLLALMVLPAFALVSSWAEGQVHGRTFCLTDQVRSVVPDAERFCLVVPHELPAAAHDVDLGALLALG